MFEELDSPSEWYFDETSHQLYYASNATSGASPTDPRGAVTMDAVQAEVLVNITGTKATPVKNVTLSGIILRDAAATFLQQHVRTRIFFAQWKHRTSVVSRLHSFILFMLTCGISMTSYVCVHQRNCRLLGIGGWYTALQYTRMAPKA